MLPLAGVRIVAVEQYGAGPVGSQHLADLGAEVIKVENRAMGGDYGRDVGPHFIAGAETSQASLFYHSFNRNKRSLTLDILSDEGRAVFHDLVRSADAVCGNNRGDVQGKLGLTYETLGKVKPSIVCVHLTAYGRDGSRANWPGYDYLMQAEAGYFALTGEPGGPPSRMGLSIVDCMAGVNMALGVVAGVLGARQSGVGRDLDVTLYNTALFNLNYLATWYLDNGRNQGREPRSAHPSLTPCALYKTKDGWIYLMCNKEGFWPKLCEKLGRPDLAADPRFARFPDRLANRPALTEALDEALSSRTTAEWLALFAGSVPAAPLYDVAQALENPFAAESGNLQDVSIPGGEDFRLLTGPVRCADEPMPANPGPALGADTDDVLRSLGYDDARIAGLRDRGVL